MEPDACTEELAPSRLGSRVRRSSCAYEQTKVTFLDAKLPPIQSTLSLPKPSAACLDPLEEYLKGSHSNPLHARSDLFIRVNGQPRSEWGEKILSTDGGKDNIPTSATARRCRRGSFLMDLVQSSTDGSQDNGPSRLAEEMNRMHAGMEEEVTSIETHKRRLAGSEQDKESADLETAIGLAIHEPHIGESSVWRPAYKPGSRCGRKLSLDCPTGRPRDLFIETQESLKRTGSLRVRAYPHSNSDLPATQINVHPSSHAGHSNSDGGKPTLRSRNSLDLPTGHTPSDGGRPGTSRSRISLDLPAGHNAGDGGRALSTSRSRISLDLPAGYSASEGGRPGTGARARISSVMAADPNSYGTGHQSSVRYVETAPVVPVTSGGLTSKLKKLFRMR